MKRGAILGFMLANLGLCLWMFRDALWGESLLAPLDILPAACSKYHFLDPASSGIPANQFIVDQITYDLPIQHTIYHAYRQGEIPWWDPFTWAGRPLLADAHINGTDPIRVLAYLCLPFELAYNWTLILHFILGGFAMLLLLRHWRFSAATCGLLALTYEFAGCFVLYFGHPWIQASFNYYPLLWLAWEAALQRRSGWHALAASALVAGVFYSGNLQSHAYLALFAAAIGLGYGGLAGARWKRVLPVLGFSLAAGAALAMPVLLGQLEMFHYGVRVPSLHSSFPVELNGPATLFAIYPWALGTFRTVDLAKFFDSANVGFHIYIGSAGVALALLGCRSRPARADLVPAQRTAWWLIGIYLLIVSTPVQNALYLRSAALGVLGLILQAALGVERLSASGEPLRRWGWFAVVVVVAAGVVMNVASLVIYPKFIPTVRQMALAHIQKSPRGLQEAHALREFQINNLANEVSFKNPETVAACVGLLGFAGLCGWPAARRHPWAIPSVLTLNLVPVLLFAFRFVPVQPVTLWHRLMADGTEQRRVARVLEAGHERLIEVSGAPFKRLYPNSLGHLFEVRTVHGYSALQPRSLILLSPAERENWLPQTADYIYESEVPGAAVGELRKNATPGSARFQWLDSAHRNLRIEKETLTQIRLAIEPGEAAELLWTDTYYPGWSARAGSENIPIERVEPCFSKIKVPAAARTLVLRYEPTYLRPGMILAGGAAALLAIVPAIRRLRKVRLGSGAPQPHGF